MIKPLRHVHFVYWKVASIALPLAFSAAIILRPQRNENNKSGEAFSASWHQQDSTLQVVIKVNSPIAAPVCLVRAQIQNEKQLLGSIDKPDTYIFRVPLSTVAVYLTDEIHEKTLATFKK